MKAEYIYLQDGLIKYEMSYKIGYDDYSLAVSNNGVVSPDWENLQLTPDNAREVVKMLQQFIELSDAANDPKSVEVKE